MRCKLNFIPKMLRGGRSRERECEHERERHRVEIRDIARVIERKREMKNELKNKDEEGKHVSTSTGGSGESGETNGGSDEKQNQSEIYPSAGRKRESGISAEFDRLIGRGMR